MFNRSEVIVLTHKHTNKQTPPKTSDVLRYATTLGNHAEQPDVDIDDVEMLTELRFVVDAVVGD